MSQVDLYQEKNTDYYGNEQEWIADLIPGKNLSILDIGCGDGITGKLLKSREIASHITGVELLPESAERAKQHLDEVFTGNIEQLTLPLEVESFDGIIMTEVLEHLVNPWRVVRTIRDYLKPGGFIIASSPNVRHYSVIWKLLRGTWQYQESGILDKTHLRFFTGNTFAELFTQADLNVELVRPIILRKAGIANRLSFRQFEAFLTFRYVCRATKQK